MENYDLHDDTLTLRQVLVFNLGESFFLLGEKGRFDYNIHRVSAVMESLILHGCSDIPFFGRVFADHQVTWAISYMIRLLLIFRLIISCAYKRTRPWRFFQLNSRYFNAGKGIFSKLDIDQYIPQKWRLKQYCYDPHRPPESYPVFVKPEWGQNSHGVVRVDSEEAYRQLAGNISRCKTSFIVQEAACRPKEYEIFYIRSARNRGECALLSITEVMNTGEDACPINSIHNPRTSYMDRTALFSLKEQDTIWHYLAGIGDFRIARCGVRTENREALLAGDFHIIEINLFLPMPLYLCDRNIAFTEKYAFICRSMALTADLIKTLRREELQYAVFFRKLLAHYRVKSWQF